MRGKSFLLLGLCAALVLTTVFASGCGEKAEPAAEGDAAAWKKLVSETDALAETRKNLAETEKVEYFDRQAALIQEMEDFSIKIHHIQLIVSSRHVKKPVEPRTRTP